MKITKTAWNRAILLEREFLRRGEELSRIKLQDSFQIPQAEAQHLIFALENKDIIRSEPDAFSGDDERVLIFSDIHIPYEDKLCIQAVIEYGLKYDPTTIILAGDVLDFYQISTFVKNPINKGISQELEMGRKFLTELRYQFPRARIIFKEGNHEQRMERYIFQSAPKIADLVDNLLTNQLNMNELKIEYVIDPFVFGKLWVLHGHEKPGGAYNPEYICNVIWNYVFDHFIVGHYHRKQQKTFKNISGKTFWTGSLGYCAGKMDYAVLNKWSQGFATVDFAKNGEFRAYNHEISDGQMY